MGEKRSNGGRVKVFYYRLVERVSGRRAQINDLFKKVFGRITKPEPSINHRKGWGGPRAAFNPAKSQNNKN